MTSVHPPIYSLWCWLQRPKRGYSAHWDARRGVLTVSVPGTLALVCVKRTAASLSLSKAGWRRQIAKDLRDLRRVLREAGYVHPR